MTILENVLTAFRKALASAGGDLSKAQNPALDLIAALRDYARTAFPGSGDAVLENKVVELFQNVLTELAASQELKISSGSPAAGMTKARQLPIGVEAINDDHREALLAGMDMTRALVRQAAKGLNKQVVWTKDTAQDMGNLEHQRGSELLKAADKPRRATSLSDPTGDGSPAMKPLGGGL